MKKLHKQTTVAILLTAAFILAGPASAQAQETEQDQPPLIAIQQQLQYLEQKVQNLQASLASPGQVEGITDTRPDPTLNYKSQASTKILEVGDQAEVVRHLQKMLAQDESLYPEGLVTGYYGPLTAEAVTRLQERVGIEATGSISLETVGGLQNLLSRSSDGSYMSVLDTMEPQAIQDIFSSEGI